MGSIFNFIRYNWYIRKAIKGENLLDKLMYLFGGRKFKTDWISRIYTVVNPYVDNISSDGNILIYDDSKPMIEKWLMDNLNIMAGFIATNNLFDLLTYKIDKIDNDENYRVVFYNVFYDKAKKELKWILIGSAVLGLIVGALAIIL